MAFNFPSNPVENQVYKVNPTITYIFKNGAWRKNNAQALKPAVLKSEPVMTGNFIRLSDLTIFKNYTIPLEEDPSQYAAIIPTIKPSPPPGYTVEENGARCEDGKWYVSWNVRPFNQEEIDAAYEKLDNYLIEVFNDYADEVAISKGKSSALKYVSKSKMANYLTEEDKTFIDWMDKCNKALSNLSNMIKEGTANVLSPEEIKAFLPKLKW